MVKLGVAENVQNVKLAMMRQSLFLWEGKLLDDWKFFINLPWHLISQRREYKRQNCLQNNEQKKQEKKQETLAKCKQAGSNQVVLKKL